MFGYRLLVAPAAVVRQSSFGHAVQALGLSQSVVSQRVKLLEARVGQPVLVRETLPHPTDLGRRLFNHVRQVRLLEGDLQRWVPNLGEGGTPERLRIAPNADSLATWWVAAVGDFYVERRVLLDLVVEGQEVGLKRMRVSEVTGYICGSTRSVTDTRSLLLGAVRYRGLTNLDFIAQHFPRGIEATALASVPATMFGPDDLLQHRFLKDLGVGGSFIHRLCPSSGGFVHLAAGGLGWGPVPEHQVQGELTRGGPIGLLPGQVIDIPLYWHYWRDGGELLASLAEYLLARVGDDLVRVAG